MIIRSNRVRVASQAAAILADQAVALITRRGRVTIPYAEVAAAARLSAYGVDIGILGKNLHVGADRTLALIRDRLAVADGAGADAEE